MIKGMMAPIHLVEKLLATTVGCVAMKHGTMLRDVTSRLPHALAILRTKISQQEGIDLEVRRMLAEHGSTIARLQRTLSAANRDTRSRDKQIGHVVVTMPPSSPPTTHTTRPF